MQLRPYQQECLDAIEAAGDGRWLCQLATGAGKTVIFSRLPRRGDTLILSHRQELVMQPLKYFDCPAAVEMGDSRASHLGRAACEVTSASVQTMSRRLESYAPDAFDTVIVDEAHHAASPTYRKILEYFRPRRTLGFTATPNRADGLGLENAFDGIIFQRDLKWCIENGWLARLECRRVNVGYDLSQVSSRMGDYAPGELERAVNVDSCNRAIAEIVRNLAAPPVLIFAVDVAHASAIAAAIGPAAKALSAKSPDRAAVIRDFLAGRLPVLVNCALFTEGTDLPPTRTVIIARPTKSAALYTQMVGRGTRLAPGKEHCLLVDCVGVSNMPLCTAPTLLGLDLDGVPAKYRKEIEGDLLADIPAAIEKTMDTPESWIDNVRIVDLWAKAQGYHLHDVNWIKLPDGSLRLRLPMGMLRRTATLQISAPDLTGHAELRTSGGYSARLPAQECYDLAYTCLRTQFADARPLWSLASAKRWGKAEANQKQRDYLKRLAYTRGIDLSGVMADLTKLQAAQLIERLKG